MKRLMTLAMPIAAALAITACGATGSSNSASATPASAAGTNTTSTTVAVRHLPGVGSVLVDNTGKALYANNLESAAKILCNDPGCNAFWMPVTVHGQPTAAASAGKLGVTKRPDGSSQVTANGKPLYTFSEDSPGKATGNGFQDQFAGHNFTWNVVLAGGTLASRAGSGSGSATSNSTGATSGNYGY
jgi:predicted lipoprotein with Yx(FWY)xxD motif